MIFRSAARFLSSNTALQGNKINVEFARADDKTNFDKSLNAIQYQYQYEIYPLRLSTNSTAYAEETTEPITESSWINFNKISETADPTVVSADIVLPNYNYDYKIVYKIRALDDYQSQPMEVEQKLHLYGIYNQAGHININTMTWESDTQILVKYSIDDLGFTRPYNFEDISGTNYTAAWSVAVGDLVAIFGDIDFEVRYRYDTTTDIKSHSWFIGEIKKLSEIDWSANTSNSFTIDNSNDVLNPDGTYYFDVQITKNNILTSSNATLDNTTNRKLNRFMLVSATHALRLKKHGIQGSFPEDDAAPDIASGMFTRTNEHTDSAGSTENTKSVALYDHHIKSGDLQPSNEPSLGFMRTDHTEIGEIKAIKRGGGEYVSLLHGSDMPISLRSNGNMLEYWDVGLDMWQTVLPSKVTTSMNGGVQWDFSDPNNVGFKIGDSMTYDPVNGLHIGPGAIGIDSLSDEVKTHFGTKTISITADGEGILYNDTTQKVDPANQIITLNAKTNRITGNISWTVLGMNSDRTTTTLRPTSISADAETITIDGSLIEPYAYLTVYARADDIQSNVITLLKIKHGMSRDIKSIKETTTWFLASSKNAGVTTRDLGFTNSPQSTTEDKPYLWMYIVTTYNDDTTDSTEPALIGRQGEDAVYVEITSQNGNVFKNGIINTTLFARVFRGDQEITSELEPSQFTWTRTSDDPQDDSYWNLNSPHMKSIVVTNQDVYHKATFNCEITGL